MPIQQRLIAASRKASRIASATHRVALVNENANRARLANQELFFLRTLPKGYDWLDSNPDKLLPTATGLNSK